MIRLEDAELERRFGDEYRQNNIARRTSSFAANVLSCAGRRCKLYKDPRRYNRI